jgi:3-hydroxyacyl-CoA dehydrogenase
MMRVRYSSIPVIVAPHGMTFGGDAKWAYMLIVVAAVKRIKSLV